MYIEGVVLAAGLSSRFEGYKMSKEIMGQSMIEHTIKTMLVHVNQIYVIVGHNKDIIENLLKKYECVTCIYNPSYLEGMYTSFKVAARHVKSEKCFFIPGDLPFVKADTYKNLLMAEGSCRIPSVDHQSGHPILLDKSIVDLMKDSDSLHMRAFLSNYEKTYVEVDDTGILKDIDTIEDYNNYTRGL